MLQISFDVSYSMGLEKSREDLAIAAGVLSALVIVYGAVVTWNWSRREGKIALTSTHGSSLSSSPWEAW